MDATSLMLSLLFGTAGIGYLMYGKKAGVVLPMIAGLGLILLPYFISNVAVMSVVCIVLMVIPFLLRDI